MNQKIKQNWERNVGRFILNTGMIELRLLQLYWNISPDGSYDVAIKKQGFIEKIKRVKKEVKASGISAPLKAEVLDVLKECSDLRKTRNLVAHNPLGMAEYYDEQEMPKYEPLIRSLRNEGNHLTEGDLIKDINATRNVIEKLSKIISDQRLQSWREA